MDEISYLSEHTFKLWFEGKVSQKKSITSGVPQGTVLSPVLFNILMSDLVKIYGVQYLEFADDLAIVYTAVDQRHVVQEMQQALREIIEWSDRWGQKLNFDKTKAQYFTNRHTFLILL